MQTPLRLPLLSHPHFLLASDVSTAKIPIHSRIFVAQKTTTVCAAKRRNVHGIAKSGKLILESAYMIASHLRIVPEPVDLILREFGAGNGGRNGFWSGFDRGGSDGWRRRRKMNLRLMGILVIIGAVGLWWIVGKDLVSNSDSYLGGLGLVVVGLSVEGWRRGARDWILGFCCCALLVGLVSNKAYFREWSSSFGSLSLCLNKGLRRRRRRRRRKGRAF